MNKEIDKVTSVKSSDLMLLELFFFFLQVVNPKMKLIIIIIRCTHFKIVKIILFSIRKGNIGDFHSTFELHVSVGMVEKPYELMAGSMVSQSNFWANEDTKGLQYDNHMHGIIQFDRHYLPLVSREKRSH